MEKIVIFYVDFKNGGNLVFNCVYKVLFVSQSSKTILKKLYIHCNTPKAVEYSIFKTIILPVYSWFHTASSVSWELKYSGIYKTSTGIFHFMQDTCSKKNIF